MMSNLKPKFMEVYSDLKSELLLDPAFEWDDVYRQRVSMVLDYNVPGGKLNRGLSVVDSYRLLKGSVLTDDEFFLSSSLGWCIEWLQASFLICDDIMDNSRTRRGQPCYYRVPQVGLVALNDSAMIRSQIHRILKNHFKGKPCYVDLLDLFHEVEFQSASGQMIDSITTLEGEKDLNKYNMDLHRRIVQYKTAYYSFYLPVASALLMFGENLDDQVDVKNILIDMGRYFQAQDDFLDCYGDPAVIGKIGTDIEDFKCSWLVVKAVELCDEEQKKLLIAGRVAHVRSSSTTLSSVFDENYGKDDQACVARVKQLYKQLNLEAVFNEYERKSYEKLCKSIDDHPSLGIQAVLRSFLGKIYKRKK